MDNLTKGMYLLFFMPLNYILFGMFNNVITIRIFSDPGHIKLSKNSAETNLVTIKSLPE